MVKEHYTSPFEAPNFYGPAHFHLVIIKRKSSVIKYMQIIENNLKKYFLKYYSSPYII